MGSHQGNRLYNTPIPLMTAYIDLEVKWGKFNDLFL